MILILAVMPFRLRHLTTLETSVGMMLEQHDGVLSTFFVTSVVQRHETSALCRYYASGNFEAADSSC